MKMHTHPKSCTPLLLIIFCGTLAAFDLALGQTWTQTGAPSNTWSSIACSADGAKLVAVVGSGRSYSPQLGPIYVSTNFGSTWTKTSAPTQDWATVASSADGTKLIAGGVLPGAICTSTNGGTTWISNNIPARSWRSAAS